MLVGIILVVIFIYCCVGAFMGVCALAQDKWPVYITGGPDNWKAIHGERTVMFMIACGPGFWFTVLLITIFKAIWKLLG